MYQRDYDQAARYLRSACGLLEHAAKAKTTDVRSVLELAAGRMSPINTFEGDVAPLVVVLQDAALEISELGPGLQDARTEILKALAVLRDG